jgi:hypothetical protein
MSSLEQQDAELVVCKRRAQLGSHFSQLFRRHHSVRVTLILIVSC